MIQKGKNSMKMKFLLSAVALACLSMSAQAEDLLESFDAARSFDPTFQGALKAYDAALQKVPQARAGLLPTVGLGASATRSDVKSSVETPGRTIDSTTGNNTYQGGVNANYPLYRPGNRVLVDQANISVQIAEAARKQAELDLVTRVSKAYFDVLAAQDALTFLRAQKQAVAEQLASAKRNFEVGTATITDTREAQARADLVVAQEIAATSDLAVKKTALQQITGKAPGQLKSLAPNPVLANPEPDSIDSWVAKSDASNNSILQAQFAEEIAKREIDKAKTGNLPTVDLTGNLGYSKQTASSTTGYPVRAGSSSIGVTLNYPLYAGGAIDARIKETLALQEKASLDTLAAKAAVAQGTRQAFLGVKSGQAQVKALEAAELSSQVALDANKLGYQVGVRINIDVLNSQSQLFQTKRDLAKARYDTLNAGLQLKSLSGDLTREDIAQVNALLTDMPTPAATPVTPTPDEAKRLGAPAPSPAQPGASAPGGRANTPAQKPPAAPVQTPSKPMKTTKVPPPDMAPQTPPPLQTK
jgi:outer membrane protein